jgi:hypothetical protein
MKSFSSCVINIEKRKKKPSQKVYQLQMKKSLSFLQVRLSIILWGSVGDRLEEEEMDPALTIPGSEDPSPFSENSRVDHHRHLCASSHQMWKGFCRVVHTLNPTPVIQFLAESHG